ncbi:ATP-dependent helicase/nuclease subunit A, partial [Striga asiatica]
MEDSNSDDAHSDSRNESIHSQEDCQKGGRGATRMPHLMLQSGNKKLKISFDCYMLPDGPTTDITTYFISCVGMLGRSKASILAENWKDGVPDKIKEQIWQTLQEIFELPNDKKLKEYWK